MKENFENIIKELNERVVTRQNMCDGYTDSGDQGACYHGQVYPLEDLIKDLNELSEKIYKNVGIK